MYTKVAVKHQSSSSSSPSSLYHCHNKKTYNISESVHLVYTMNISTYKMNIIIFSISALISLIMPSLYVSNMVTPSHFYRLVQYFIKEFHQIMDNPDSSSKQISLAVRGYGYFAAVGATFRVHLFYKKFCVMF